MGVWPPQEISEAGDERENSINTYRYSVKLKKMSLSQNFVVTGESGEIETNFLTGIRLEDGYEVALSSFHSSPICNCNFESDTLYLQLMQNDEVVAEGAVPVPHNYYHTTGDVFVAINDSINKYITEHSHQWGNQRSSVAYNPQKGVWALTLSNKLSIVNCDKYERNILNMFTLPDGDYKSLTVPEKTFDERIESALIYSSIVEGSYINGFQSRLLAVVPVRFNSLYTQFDPPCLKFYRIAIEEFSSILFEIRNTRGNLIEFANGHTGCGHSSDTKLTCKKHHETFGDQSRFSETTAKNNVIMSFTLRKSI